MAAGGLGSDLGGGGGGGDSGSSAIEEIILLEFDIGGGGRDVLGASLGESELVVGTELLLFRLISGAGRSVSAGAASAECRWPALFNISSPALRPRLLVLDLVFPGPNMLEQVKMSCPLSSQISHHNAALEAEMSVTPSSDRARSRLLSSEYSWCAPSGFTGLAPRDCASCQVS